MTGWFWGALSGVRHFFDSPPYITYAVIGVTAGVVVYFVGGSRIGRTAKRSLSDPASTARIIQSNANLRAEMEATRSAMNKVRDTLIDVKVELRRVNANSIVELAQQSQATDTVVRETASMLTMVNINLLSVYESIIQLAAASGNA